MQMKNFEDHLKIIVNKHFKDLDINVNMQTDDVVIDLLFRSTYCR
jgi:hypothetical protein